MHPQAGICYAPLLNRQEVSRPAPPSKLMIMTPLPARKLEKIRGLRTRVLTLKKGPADFAAKSGQQVA